MSISSYIWLRLPRKSVTSMVSKTPPTTLAYASKPPSAGKLVGAGFPARTQAEAMVNIAARMFPRSPLIHSNKLGWVNEDASRCQGRGTLASILIKTQRRGKSPAMRILLPVAIHVHRLDSVIIFDSPRIRSWNILAVRIDARLGVHNVFSILSIVIMDWPRRSKEKIALRQPSSSFCAVIIAAEFPVAMIEMTSASLVAPLPGAGLLIKCSGVTPAIIGRKIGVNIAAKKLARDASLSKGKSLTISRMRLMASANCASGGLSAMGGTTKPLAGW